MRAHTSCSHAGSPRNLWISKPTANDVDKKLRHLTNTGTHPENQRQHHPCWRILPRPFPSFPSIREDRPFPPGPSKPGFEIPSPSIEFGSGPVPERRGQTLRAWVAHHRTRVPTQVGPGSVSISQQRQRRSASVALPDESLGPLQRKRLRDQGTSAGTRCHQKMSSVGVRVGLKR